MKAFSITDIGKKRQLNQDHIYSSLEPVGNLPNIFLVADGMGGHKAGGYASSCAVETILEGVRESEGVRPEEILTEAIQRANEVIEKRAGEDERFSGMGTTVVAACWDGKELIAANVGDSRLYVVGDRIRQITQDHSLVQEMVRLGEMDQESARTHPDRNIITRAIGADRKVQADVFETVLEPGDRILLCSDGLTNMVEDDEILRILNGSGDLVSKTEYLVELANRNGGKDNITVITIEP